MAGGKPMALYQGNCTGHGFGAGGFWHPGPGGGPVAPCSGSPKLISIQPRSIAAHTAMWKGIAQLPLTPASAVTNVVVNGKIPILDQDLLTPHPTTTMYQAIRTQGDCTITAPTPAYWCHTYTGIGTVAGREPEIGHVRKCISTTKSVFINGKRVGRMGDPLGDGSSQFPCLSKIAGSSKNVIVGV